MSTETWREARNLLCVRLDSMGDVLMTTPALRALKNSIPNARLTLLTSPAGAEVAALIPEVDAILVYEAPWMKVEAATRGADLSMLGQLSALKFDAAVIFTTSTQSALPAALLCYLAGIPLRLAHARENPYHLLTDWVPDSEPSTPVRHEVRRQLDLVAAAGARTADERLSLAVPRWANARVEALLAELGLGAGCRWIAVHSGASAASRRYAPEHFAAVIDTLWHEQKVRCVLTGSERERGLVASIEEQTRAPLIDLAGRLELAELAALVGQTSLLISNNSGPVHIAAALGTPVVDIYALTNPQHTPWQVPHRLLTHEVPCRNCLKSTCPEGHHDCLRLIPPQEVVDAATSLLASSEVSASLPSPA